MCLMLFTIMCCARRQRLPKTCWCHKRTSHMQCMWSLRWNFPKFILARMRPASLFPHLLSSRPRQPSSTQVALLALVAPQHVSRSHRSGNFQRTCFESAFIIRFDQSSLMERPLHETDFRIFITFLDPHKSEIASLHYTI